MMDGMHCLAQSQSNIIFWQDTFSSVFYLEWRSSRGKLNLRHCGSNQNLEWRSSRGKLNLRKTHFHITYNSKRVSAMSTQENDTSTLRNHYKHLLQQHWLLLYPLETVIV